MFVKEKFHQLIDQIKDENTLKAYLNLIINSDAQVSGNLYAALSEDQKAELAIAYNESFDKSNLLAHEQVKSQYFK